MKNVQDWSHLHPLHFLFLAPVACYCWTYGIHSLCSSESRHVAVESSGFLHNCFCWGLMFHLLMWHVLKKKPKNQGNTVRQGWSFSNKYLPLRLCPVPSYSSCTTHYLFVPLFIQNTFLTTLKYMHFRVFLISFSGCIEVHVWLSFLVLLWYASVSV